MRKRMPQVVLAVGGVGLIAWGLGLVYLPLAPIFLGGTLLVELLTSGTLKDGDL